MLIRYASAIVLIASGILLILALFGAAGPVGTTVFEVSYMIVGIGAFLLPLALIAVGLYAGFRAATHGGLPTSTLLFFLGVGGGGRPRPRRAHQANQ